MLITDTEARLQAMRMATDVSSLDRGTDNILRAAEEFYNFITNKGPQAPPTPPYVSLVYAFEKIAEARHILGMRQGNTDVYTALDGAYQKLLRDNPMLQGYQSKGC
jgi:hypothetical protein